MNNILIVNYKVASEAYQALSELRRAAATDNYVISQAVIVKKETTRLSHRMDSTPALPRQTTPGRVA